jgi:glycosyltransferase involved in cell wall biosynthesis
VRLIKVAEVVRPASGGMRRHVSSILAELDRSEFEATLFAPAAFAVDYARDIRKVCVPIGARSSLLMDLVATVALSRKLRGRFDLVHAHGIRGAVIGVPAARLAHVPAVFTAHNLVPDSTPVTSAILRSIARTAQPIAVSEAVAASLAAHGVERRRIIVIPNGITASDFDRPPLDEAARLDILSGLVGDAADGAHRCAAGLLGDADRLERPPFVVAAIGRLSHEKGFDVLADAFLSHSRNSGRGRGLLLIAGAGPEEVALRRALAGAPNAVLLGPLADVAPLLAVADVVTIPSREEGQSIVALEAMASRKPVVASRVGGLAETVVDGGTGILVPPGDAAALGVALDALADAPETRRAMGDAGLARVLDRYTLAQMMERLTAVYREASGKAAERLSRGGAD